MSDSKPESNADDGQYWHSLEDAIIAARKCGDVAPLLAVSWYKWWHPHGAWEYQRRNSIIYKFVPPGHKQSATASIAGVVQQHEEARSWLQNNPYTQVKFAMRLDLHLERKKRYGRKQGDLRLSELRDALIECFGEFEVRPMPRLFVGQDPPIPGKDIPSLVWPSQRQFARWAARRIIPGAYPIKRGHYRVRVCKQLVLWATKHIMQHEWEEHLRETRRVSPILNAVISKLSLEAHMDPAFALFLDGPLSNIPLAFLPNELFQVGQKAAIGLRIAEIANSLSKQPKYKKRVAKSRDGTATKELWQPLPQRKVTVAEVLREYQKESRLSRAEFYRQRYHNIVKQLTSRESTRKDAPD